MCIFGIILYHFYDSKKRNESIKSWYMDHTEYYVGILKNETEFYDLEVNKN